MPFEKLTAHQVDAYNSPYAKVLRDLEPGEGAHASVDEEGVTKITLKRRLEKAADVAGVEIKFHRSSADEVILEVVDKDDQA